MSIKRVMIGAGDLCAAVLTLMTAFLIGNGGAVPAWMMMYLGALSFVALLGLWARCWYE